MNKITKSWGCNERPYYHFTTLDSFNKIRESGKLRLSSCNDVKNAAVETMALYAVVKNTIDNNDDLRSKLLCEFNCEEEADLINAIVAYRETTYVVCFSLFDGNREREGLLANSYMWKFYADNGDGVVIKFNYECFPYYESGTKGEYDGNSNFQRLSEARIRPVEYEESKIAVELNKFKKYHHLFTDFYKPVCCQLEKEIRMLFYLHKREDLYGFDGFSEAGGASTERPSHLFYDFGAKERTLKEAAIQTVFCKSKETQNQLCDSIDRNLVVCLS